MDIKRYGYIAGLLMLLTGPVFGQTNEPNVPQTALQQQPLSRSEVRQQFVDLWSVGYRPAEPAPWYPHDIQEAQRRVACKRGEQQAGAAEAEWIRRCNINVPINNITIGR
ncbi:DUF4148 domain-containing protein [Burkholderia sp. SRS-W-2-2016]|uniref:DUF4148 domain-containing protein n=1 Tax=Burkholderia sp. SRS-W-2-2016 TaxID=1926878 RepID=UPI00117C01FA|nr:DUF4148 domain-containing protein [Burkholderia sp. SRS-W-2-2016]